MTYTPPLGSSIEIDLSGTYTPPDGGAIVVDLGSEAPPVENTNITAKSVVLDIADGWGTTTLALRSVDFYLSGVLVDVVVADISTYATSTWSGLFSYNVFLTALPKTGTWSTYSWASPSGTYTNQRLIVVFNSDIEFDKVVINNMHHNGTTTEWGCKNVVITSSTDAITSTVYNDTITNPTVLFDGILDEHVAADTEDPQIVYEYVGEPVEILTEYMSILTQPYSLLQQLLSILTQSYDMEKDAILSILRQPYEDKLLSLSILRQMYGIHQEYLGLLRQPYLEEFTTALRQAYGDKNLFTSPLRQPYGDRNLLLSKLRQSYRDKNQFISLLRQGYTLNEELLAKLSQPYSIKALVGVSIIRQSYDILEIDELLSTLRQRYSLIPDELSTPGNLPELVEVSDDPVLPGEPPTSPLPSTVVGFGEKDGISEMSIKYDLDAYCGSFSLEVTSEGVFNTFEDLSAVKITLDGIDHISVVTGKTTSDSFGKRSFVIASKSPAVLLDYPYAKKITEDFLVEGTASEVCNAIAALEGFVVEWHMTSNPPQTSSTFDVAGSYPLQAIRSLINELGGRVQSHPDGTIHIVKRQPVDSDKYAEAVVESILTTLSDFENVSTNYDQRSGDNSFSVSSEATDYDYTLSTEEVTASKFIVKANKVPWVSDPVELVTSELTNVEIVALGLTTKTIEVEDVEIIEGVGSVSEPCYDEVVWDYGTRTNLGNITISESGEITSDIAGNTLVNVTYLTKYWAWETTDSDYETVQFILFTVV